MDEQTVDIRDICAILLRNFWLIVIIMAATIALSIALIVYLPKQFKSKGVISINSSYFNSPLVSDTIGSVYDPTELKSQRQALLQQVLVPKFVDKVGYKFNEYTENVPEAQHVLERERLRERIEVFPINTNSSQVSVKAGDRYKAYNMTKMIIEEMQRSLILQRKRRLLATRDALDQEINAIRTGIRKSEQPSTAKRSEKVGQELEKAKVELEMALSSYSELHPTVKRLRKNVKVLQLQYNKLAATEKTADSDVLDVDALNSARGSYDELLKKRKNLNILLNIEKTKDDIEYIAITEIPEVPAAPIFPNSKMFLMCGIVAGLVLSGVVVMFLELKRGTFVSSYYVMDQLDMPMLGELPYDKNMQQELLLLETIEHRSQKLLTGKNEQK